MELFTLSSLSIDFYAFPPFNDIIIIIIQPRFRRVISEIHWKSWILSGNTKNDSRLLLGALFVAMQWEKND